MRFTERAIAVATTVVLAGSAGGCGLKRGEPNFPQEPNISNFNCQRTDNKKDTSLQVFTCPSGTIITIQTRPAGADTIESSAGDTRFKVPEKSSPTLKSQVSRCKIVVYNQHSDPKNASKQSTVVETCTTS